MKYLEETMAIRYQEDLRFQLMVDIVHVFLKESTQEDVHLALDTAVKQKHNQDYLSGQFERASS